MLYNSNLLYHKINAKGLSSFTNMSHSMFTDMQKTTTKASTTKASTTKASTTKASTTKASTTKASTTKASTTKKPTTKILIQALHTILVLLLLKI